MQLNTREHLILAWNQVPKIEGLEHPVNRDELHPDFNRTSRVEGLGTLVKLERLGLKWNTVCDEDEMLFHVLTTSRGKNDMQDVHLACGEDAMRLSKKGAARDS